MISHHDKNLLFEVIVGFRVSFIFELTKKLTGSRVYRGSGGAIR